LAYCYRLNKKWRNACYAFDDGITVDAKYISFYLGKAATYRDQSKDAEGQVTIQLLQYALEQCKIACEIDEKNASLYYIRATVENALSMDVELIKNDLRIATRKDKGLKEVILDENFFENYKEEPWFIQITRG
jgi:hypothetical protein